jgi:ribosome biogenesis GTPase
VLETVGLDAELTRSAARWAGAADATLGRVLRVDRGLVLLLTEDGPRRAGFGGGLLGLVATDPTEAPCAGDWCVLRDWPDQHGTVERVLPRRTAVVREVAGSQDLVLCSNVDIVAVVVALHPAPVLGRVQRLVATACRSGARPLVALTKCDAVVDAGALAHRVAEATPGVELLTLSARTGEGVQQLRDRLQGRLTVALVGAAGHGRSSLTDALVGTDVLAPRAVREAGCRRQASDRRGLVPLPGGGAVIDTPAPREAGNRHAGPGPRPTMTAADVHGSAR